MVDDPKKKGTDMKAKNPTEAILAAVYESGRTPHSLTVAAGVCKNAIQRIREGENVRSCVIDALWAELGLPPIEVKRPH